MIALSSAHRMHFIYIFSWWSASVTALSPSAALEMATQSGTPKARDDESLDRSRSPPGCRNETALGGLSVAIT